MKQKKSHICGECSYKNTNYKFFPCVVCKYCMGDGYPDKFTSTVEMPTVKPPKEEINHPDRYNTGGVECIDIMVKIFGVKAVMYFCKLNAFKYIWREQHKNGVEDIEKAIWYLNKYVELSQDINENV